MVNLLSQLIILVAALWLFFLIAKINYQSIKNQRMLHKSQKHQPPLRVMIFADSETPLEDISSSAKSIDEILYSDLKINIICRNCSSPCLRKVRKLKKLFKTPITVINWDSHTRPLPTIIQKYSKSGLVLNLSSGDKIKGQALLSSVGVFQDQQIDATILNEVKPTTDSIVENINQIDTLHSLMAQKKSKTGLDITSGGLIYRSDLFSKKGRIAPAIKNNPFAQIYRKKPTSKLRGFNFSTFITNLLFITSFVACFNFSESNRWLILAFLLFLMVAFGATLSQTHQYNTLSQKLNLALLAPFKSLAFYSRIVTRR